MELISVSHIQHIMNNQYGKYKTLRVKLNQFFSQFVDRYRDFEYIWLDDKVYIEAKHSWQIKKDIEKMLNKPIKPLEGKRFPDDFICEYLDAITVKKKIAQKHIKKKQEIELKKDNIRNDFFATVQNIKKQELNSRYIGSFDLEFWENDMNIILEFGWSIIDYQGQQKTVHIVVQENLDYENGVFSKNNRFSRTDSKIIPLKIALEKFKNEFLNCVDIFVGHGLSNDYKVLKANGIDIKKSFIDTAIVGGVIMGENDMVSLERLLDYLKIQHDDLHNAANDAEFVLKAFFEMGDL